MSTPGPDHPESTPPPAPELGGLDPQDLLQAGLDTVPPVTLPPQPSDPDVTMPVSRPQPSQPSPAQPELPMPEELTALLPGGNYHVESFLGQGGMGAVYKGTQVRLKRPVAIKIMRRDFGKDYDFEARFEREAQAMAKLNHPNIVSVIDFGEAGPDYLYIVMELVDGADMMDVIRTGRMTQEMALTLLPQICDALQFAHDHGIVHRDIKPSNIMLTRDGRIKMADFGLAKRFDAESSFRTQTGTGMGTPDYAAPEQFDAHAPIDHRADIYALGVMIYQMITGQLPRGVWKPPSQRAEIAPQWDDIVSRAMQSDPKDRYQQASEVKTDVSSIPLTQGSAKERSADTPVRPSSKGGAAAKNNEAGRSARAPVKSRAALAIGTVVIGLIAFAAVMFATRGKQSSAGLEPAPASPAPIASKPAQAATTPAAKAGGDGLKPGTTLAAATAAPIAATTLPESGWKPLFTDAEWKKNEGSLREFKDGLLHLHGGLRKPQTSPDGAIRARIQLRPDSIAPGLTMRFRNLKEGYSFSISSDRKAVFLTRAGELKEFTELGKFPLPKPLSSNAVVTLELRIQGEILTALVDGQTVGTAKDSQIKESNEWGLGATDGWFESVEVQSLPAAATPAPIAAPALPESGWKPLFTEAEWKAGSRSTDDQWREFKDGLLHMHVQHFKKPQDSPDGTIRAAIVIRAGSETVAVTARHSDSKGYYKLGTINDAKSILLTYFGTDKSATYALLGKYEMPRPLRPGDKLLLELRVQGNHLTGLVNGTAVIDAQDDRLKAAGEWGIHAKDGWFESVEVQPLPAAATPAPIAATALPESGWKPLFTETEWRLAIPGKREFKNGVLHLAHSSIEKPWPTPDAGIRAEILIRGNSSESSRPNLKARSSEKGSYRLGLGADAKHLFLAHMPSGANPTADILAKHFLAKPVTSGDKLQLELRVTGDHLIGFLDGQPVIEAHDSRLNGPGICGITAEDAWFESVEVQPLPAAVAAIKLWDTPEKLPKQAGVSWENGAVKIERTYLYLPSPKSRDAMLRASVRMTSDNAGGALLHMRHVAGKVPLMLALNFSADPAHGIELRPPGATENQTALQTWPMPRAYGADEWARFEMRVIGDQISVSIDGQLLGTIKGTSPAEPGEVGLYANRTAYFRDIEYMPLDAPAVSPSPNLPISKSSATPAAEPWQDALSNPSELDLQGDVRVTATGLEFSLSGGAELKQGPNRDGAVRVVTTYDAGKGILLRGRTFKLLYYGLTLDNDKQVSIRRYDNAGATSTLIRTFAITSPLHGRDFMELELRIVGDKLTAKLNGQVIGEVSDSSIQEGRFGIISPRAIPAVTKFHYLNLDGVSPSPNLPISLSPSLPIRSSHPASG